MKNIISAIFALILILSVFSFAACSDEEKDMLSEKETSVSENLSSEMNELTTLKEKIKENLTRDKNASRPEDNSEKSENN